MKKDEEYEVAIDAMASASTANPPGLTGLQVEIKHQVETKDMIQHRRIERYN